MTEDALSGRHVVVTGGMGALGRVVAARLIAAGATCHVPDHRPEGGAAGHERLRVTPGVDLADEAAVAGFYGALPGLWASVHLSGGFAMAPLRDTGRAEFLRMLDLNALTAFLCCRAAVGVMRGAGQGGRIVNVAARPALEPRRGAQMVAYAASKAAVAALTQALAEELKGEGILVNAIAPSTIDTAANRAAMPKADPAKWLAPKAAAEAVLHLISPANSAISGAVLPLYARA
ncbi:MAG: SDR family NAD(P)-dependent oxidoreductase [Proteobacteria bacterium]|nr:SDR family NAD(P)-dependent oxidoreductase [Pseudomonadota bacterium]MBS0571817.1 SDR family NAD(P)-dependent oxidoreductase [Pseudomonadota bacterium]